MSINRRLSAALEAQLKASTDKLSVANVSLNDLAAAKASVDGVNQSNADELKALREALAAAKGQLMALALGTNHSITIISSPSVCYHSDIYHTKSNTSSTFSHSQIGTFYLSCRISKLQRADSQGSGLSEGHDRRSSREGCQSHCTTSSQP